jgi:spore germination protein YaaH
MGQPAAQRHVVRRRLAIPVLIAAALSVAVSIALAAPSRPADPGPGPPRPLLRPAGPGPPSHLFAFLSGAGGAELSHLRRYGTRIDVLAPNWFALRLSDDRVVGAPSRTVTGLARAERVALWPVVNATVTGGALGVAAARVRIAAAVAAVAARYGYGGMTLDLERLPVAESGAFTRLVALVAARLHAAHRHLAVYVPRRTADGGDVAYDWPALAGVADLLIASGYNEHAATSAPGPVTTAAGFAQMLRYAAPISRTRVAPAVGAFGYSWPVSGGDGTLISSVAAERWRRQAGARLEGAGGDAFFRARGRIVHFQTAAALIARARDARDVAMRWLALFSLGREPDAFWAGLATARAP